MRKFIYLFCLFSGILLSPETYSQGKEKINILNSNSLEYSKSIGEGVRRFIGNVIFEHNNATMYCDSAYLYSQQNFIHAFSNVHVSRGDTMHIYGDFMLYNGNTDIGKFRNNVRLEDEETVLYTDSLDFNTFTNIANYFEGGKIINSDSSELTSLEGIYYGNDDLFFFRDSVIANSPDIIIYTDSLKYNTEAKIAYFIGPTNIYNEDNHLYAENGWYNTQEEKYRFRKNARYQNKEKILTGDNLYFDKLKGIGIATGNVEMTDTTDNLILKGNYAYYNEEPESFFITDSAFLIQVSDISDSLFLHADTISSVYDSTGTYRILKAFNKVSIYRDDFQGRCDSMVYNTQDSVITMYTEPILWSEGRQMTSLKVEIQIKNSKIDFFRLINTAFIVSQEDTSRYNQIRGKEMIGYIRNSKLHKIDVFGNGQTIYFTKDGEEIIGVNSAESSNLTIYMKNGQLDRINMINDPEGVLYPIGELEETKLKGFQWLEKLRPKSKGDIFKWF
ncbi:MAG: hypothetical protein KOO66_03410 [Bacteroidales bacterium]|nr:hypothetical protein [Bacteroidales bacterium]